MYEKAITLDIKSALAYHNKGSLLLSFNQENPFCMIAQGIQFLIIYDYYNTLIIIMAILIVSY